MFKLIISPEFGEHVDLKQLTRQLMARVESDLGHPLEWAAVAHFFTVSGVPEKEVLMNSWIDGAPNADPVGSQPPTTPLDSLAAEVDRQLVLDLGGEFLDGSGFESESESPEPDFETEVQGNA